ncbi:MAG: anthranilate synthase component I family protein [Thermoleophilia bacterium]|nr:anthranilate synthase component I family protein [Thermoleophilia bacterium]
MIVPVAGRVDPDRVLAALAHRPWPLLVRHGGRTVVASDPAETVSGAAVWDALSGPMGAPAGPLAMAGGWAGLLAYDLGGTVERLPEPLRDPGGPPCGALGRYDAVLVVDPDGRAHLAAVAGAPQVAVIEAALARARALPAAPAGAIPPLATSLPAPAYRAAVERARALIRAGDCYQVNLVQRVTAAWPHGAPALAARLWRAAGAASHRAYLGLPEGVVVSASPERLVRAAGGVAWSEPIKGTGPPGGFPAVRASAKDRAEHVMIVDLVRNDLGRVARPGGVSVPRLMAPLTTPYADHMVSVVRADLAPGTTPAALLRALFPGGSVTGAPKVRAMEVIRDLEPAGRGPAFGSVVSVGADGSVEASVAIRTAWVPAGAEEARYWCGGAVVWDSSPEAERREAWRKAAPFLQALGG